MDITNKIVVITGGIGGIGSKTIHHLLKNSAKFVAILDILDQSHERVTKNLSELQKDFRAETYGYYQCDVTKFTDFENCYNKISETMGYVDILINMAGILNDKLVDLSIDVNYKAVVKCTLHAIDHMSIQKGGKGGVIVCIASTAGLRNLPFTPVYNASKHAVVSFVRSLKEHNQFLGLRVVCICPNFTDTDLMNLDPDNVTAAIIEIIKKGEPGAVWVTEDDKSPYGIKEIDEKEKLRYEL
ncbi:hypothetical protein QAD02_023877 [Eretmocerus hayati]|uniref:Uncharacterized protein n=1 Tax=Eretmocerus hayati TaxID=131215 RepID=A0ACC2PXG4_9HYME|nr:hypothetical protein QAD02_023877 [Eretmocerus hayati]